MGRRSQSSRHGALSSFLRVFFRGETVFFGWLNHPPHGSLAGGMVGDGKIVAAGVLEAQATPPNRFAPREGVADKIDPGDILPIRHQSLDEFSLILPPPEERSRLFMEFKVRANFGGCSGLDFDQRSIVHNTITGGFIQLILTSSPWIVTPSGPKVMVLNPPATERVIWVRLWIVTLPIPASMVIPLGVNSIF